MNLHHSHSIVLGVDICSECVREVKFVVQGAPLVMKMEEIAKHLVPNSFAILHVFTNSCELCISVPPLYCRPCNCSLQHWLLGQAQQLESEEQTQMITKKWRKSETYSDDF